MPEGYYKDYSYIYDRIYNNKNYRKEFAFIHKIIKKNSPSGKLVLDLGCGTGSYTHHFLQKNYIVTGVDISNSMISLAKKKLKGTKNVTFLVKDIRKLKLKKKFDIIVSLFDVISFLRYKNDANIFFKVIRSHLKKNGIAIFDFWNQSAIEKLKPAKREKKIKYRNLEILKKSDPIWFKKNGLIKVNYIINVIKDKKKIIKKLKGHHFMKYYGTKNIEKLAKKNKLKVTKFLTLLNSKMRKNSWSVLAVVKG
jgi:SAM-dependent methyltransferase